MTDYHISLAAAGGDRRLYERYLEAMRRAKSPDEYYRYFYALTEFRDPALLRRTLDFAMSDEVKNQDAGGLIASVIFKPFGREIGWSYVEKEWAAIEKKMPERMLGGILGSGRVFCDADSLERVKAFYAKHPVKNAARTMAQSVERVGVCVALREKQSTNLHAWLASDAAAPRRESSTSPRGGTSKPRR